jgi:integrase
MPKMLTKGAVEKLKPLPDGVREVPDRGAAGLRLCIWPSGKKSWAMRFRRPSGEHAKLTLGPLDLTARETSAAPVIGQPLSLTEARALAAEVNRQRAAGIDVAARHVQEKKRRAAASDEPTTFEAVARRFAEEHALKNRSGRVNTARVLGLQYPKEKGGEPTVIKGGLADRWRDRSVADVDAGDCYGAIAEAVRSGVPGLKTARKGARDSRGRAVAAALSKLFSWAVAHRLRASNPCTGVFKPPKAEPRHRVLTDGEIKKVWAAFDRVGHPFGTVAKLLLLTGQRRAEVSGLRWSELSEDRAVWNLPAARTKNKKPHTIPLPAAARDVIASVPKIVGQDLLFSKTGETAVSGWSKAKRVIDAAPSKAKRAIDADPSVALPEWRVHDLRRTAASGMQKLGVRSEVVERALNHVSGAYAGVAGVYQRDPMTKEVSAALELWANHVVSVVAGKSADVVPLRPGADAQARAAAQ